MKKNTPSAINIYFCELASPNAALSKNSIFNHLKNLILKKYIPRIVSNPKVVDSKQSLDTRGIMIAFTRMRDLHDNVTYNYILQNGDRENIKKGLRSELKDASEAMAYPVILIGLEDFTGRLEEKKRKQKNYLNIDTEIEILQQLNLDPRVKFFDSCIWYRYVPLNDKFENNFKAVFEDVVGNFDTSFRLYETNVAREYLEFQTRMMVNSRLAAVYGGHASEVTPFKFHSEMLMAQKADEEFEELCRKFKNLQWDALLIDDFAEKQKLRIGNDHTGPTKRQVIEKLLRYKLPDRQIITIETAQPEDGILDDEEREGSFILGACAKLDEKMYDIIFLDYLLGDRNVIQPSKEVKKIGREYGNELLGLIEHGIPISLKNIGKVNLLHNIGPIKRFWFFPISAFSYAMLDELREQGIAHLSEHWHLASGADPVNTPHLFRYKLYKFMNLQIGRVKAELDEFLQTDFLMKVEKKNVSRQAKEFYPEFVRYQGNYHSLIDDIEKKSTFAQKMYTYLSEYKYSYVVWEHLHNLIYLLAFGTGAEWPEMWEEYNYVKHQIKNFEEEDNKIQDHIIGLQQKYK